jgi:hypothetical protein
MQTATVVINFVLQAIATRSMQPFLPARDYKWFIEKRVELYGSIIREEAINVDQEGPI